MKTKFYNTHTKADDINDIDADWLSKQLANRPYDVQYKYLQALLQIGKGKSYIESLGKLLFDTNGLIRIGALLQRSEKQNKSSDNVLDSVSIKSKKSVKSIETSSILAGITEVNPKLYENKKSKSKKRKKANKSGELEIDVITVEDDITTSISSNFNLEEDDEEEEYVSDSVPDVKPAISDPATIVQVVSSQATRERPLSRSELVEIEHSSFTKWLQGLPSIDNDTVAVMTEDSNSGAISEPLARLLGAQGHKTDAIVMYKQLMLKYPEKSSFFADQIKKLS